MIPARTHDSAFGFKDGQIVEMSDEIRPMLTLFITAFIHLRLNQHVQYGYTGLSRD